MRLSISLFLILIPFLMGATYYVAPTGFDQQDGLNTSAWKTLEYACNQVKAGDHIVLKDGFYQQSAICQGMSGTEQNPIVIQAEHSGKVIMSAAKDITGWQKESERHWISVAIENISVHGVSLWRVGDLVARHLVDESELDEEGEFSFRPASKQFVIYEKKDPAAFSWKVWDKSATALSLQGIDWYVIDGLVFQYNNIGLLVGCSSCGRPTNHILVKNSISEYATHWAMAATSGPNELAQYITFDSVTLRYVSGSSPQHKTHNEYCFKFAANTDNAGGKFGVIQNSDVHDCGGHGIQASNGWSEITMDSNSCHDISLKKSGSGSCLRCGTTTGCTITNNKLYGGKNPQGTGICLQDGANNIRITGNKILGFDWHGIYIFSPSAPAVYNVEISNNDINDNKTTGIRIDAASAQEGGIRIENNRMIDNGSNHGAGINLAKPGIEGVSIKNNLLQNHSSYALMTAEGVDFKLENNRLERWEGKAPIKYQGKNLSVKEINKLGYANNK